MKFSSKAFPFPHVRAETFRTIVLSLHAYTYAGYRFDKETGLYYLNARYYEAGIGRFLTKDSVFTPKKYAYAAGDPVNYVDPSGDIPVLLAVMLAGGIAGAAVYAYESIKNDSFTWTGLGTAFFKEGSLAAVGAGIGNVLAKVTGKIVGGAASKVVSQGVSGVSSKVASQEAGSAIKAREHTVYTLRDPITEEVKYVGRTVNPTAREAAHKLLLVKKFLYSLLKKQG